jgi:hypothetical protein
MQPGRIGVKPMTDETKFIDERFDTSLDDATHAVIAEFKWMKLPEGAAFSALLYRVNDALTQIMRAYKPR